VRTREAVVHGTFLIAMASFGTAGGLFLEIREEFLVRDLRTFFPLRVNGGNGVLCFALAGRGCANESPSRTIATPAIAFAALSSQERSVAPNEGGRRTLP